MYMITIPVDILESFYKDVLKAICLYARQLWSERKSFLPTIKTELADGKLYAT